MDEVVWTLAVEATSSKHLARTVVGNPSLNKLSISLNTFASFVVILKIGFGPQIAFRTEPVTGRPVVLSISL